jgi:hypothetical protein
LIHVNLLLEAAQPTAILFSRMQTAGVESPYPAGARRAFGSLPGSLNSPCGFRIDAHGGKLDAAAFQFLTNS